MKRTNLLNIKVILLVFFLVIATPYIFPNIPSFESIASIITVYLTNSEDVIFPAETINFFRIISIIILILIAILSTNKKHRRALGYCTMALILFTVYGILVWNIKIYNDFIKLPVGFFTSKEYRLENLDIKSENTQTPCGGGPTSFRRLPRPDTSTCVTETYAIYYGKELLATKDNWYPAGGEYNSHSVFVRDQFSNLAFKVLKKQNSR